MSSMQLEITKETSERVMIVSKELGMEKKEFVERALLLYLDQMNKYAQLKKEMNEWDILSDEVLTDFEETL